MQNIKMYSWSAWVNNLVQTVRTRPSSARMGALCCSNPLTMYPQANYMSVLLWIRTVTQPALKNSSQWRIQKWLKEGLISPFSPSLSSSSPSSSFLLKNGGGLHCFFGSRGGWSPPRPGAGSASDSSTHHAGTQASTFMHFWLHSVTWYRYILTKSLCLCSWTKLAIVFQ